MPEKTILVRSEIPESATWNAASVFENYEAWENSLKELPKVIAEIGLNKGSINESANTLYKSLQAVEEAYLIVYKVFVYAGMSNAVDTGNQIASRMNSQARGAYAQVLAAASFIEPELLEIGSEVLNQWMVEIPDLQKYKHYLNNLFRKQEHVRSSDVEELLGLVTDPFQNLENTTSLLVNSDLKFTPAHTFEGMDIPVTASTFDNMMAEVDRELRRTAYESYTTTFLGFKNTLASLLMTSVKASVFRMRARRHKSTLEDALFRDNIPEQVFYNLIDTYQRHLPIWRRYWSVRKKALGVDTLQPYDIWAPLTLNPPTLSYEEAVDLICKGLAPLGSNYVEIIRRGCHEQRWVDWMPNIGKLDGAFSGGAYGTHPFILMSFDGSMISLGTLAHELGHSMHSYLTWQNQPIVYSEYASFVAEVASNFHQAMLRAYLLNNIPDRDFQMGVIDEAMANFHRYFFIMPTLARFELEVHQREERGEGMSADDMNTLMADLFAEGYGDEMDYDRERIGITWATFTHLYMDYYVFQYATGISGANALANHILRGEPDAVDQYLEFLKSGSSDYPINVLKKAGVDLTSSDPVEETFQVLSGLIDKLEGLISKS
jgi:oligoendopeptidase F